jgi:hypothetical protein
MKLVDSGLESLQARALVHAAALMKEGLGAEEVSEAAIVRPITDDPELHKAMLDILQASF